LSPNEPHAFRHRPKLPSANLPIASYSYDLAMFSVFAWKRLVVPAPVGVVASLAEHSQRSSGCQMPKGSTNLLQMDSNFGQKD